MIDARVAKSIRYWRQMLGMTQSELGDAIGVTYQQMHKYETQLTKLTAGRVKLIADALGVSVDELYEETPDLGGEDRMLFEFTQAIRGLNEAQLEALAGVMAVMR